MSDLNIPRTVESQKVEVSLGDLAGLVKKQAVTDDEPRISKEDFLRLAKLKIQKCFAPKINAVERRIEKLKKEQVEARLGNKATAMAEKIAEADAKPMIKQVNDLLTAFIKANDGLNALNDQFDKKWSVGFGVMPDVKVTNVAYVKEMVVYTILWTNYAATKKMSCKPTAAFLALEKKRADANDKIFSAMEDKKALEASLTKALGEIVDEVEMSLLETSISKSNEDSALAKEINERLDKQMNTMLLSE